MDEITNAILTNPELLERAQGKDIRIKLFDAGIDVVKEGS